MKRLIYACIVSIMSVAIFNSCKEEQWYSNEEIQAMKELTEKMIKYLTKEQQQITNDGLHWQSVFKDTLIYKKNSTEVDTILQIGDATPIFISSQRKYGEDILTGYVLGSIWTEMNYKNSDNGDKQNITYPLYKYNYYNDTSEKDIIDITAFSLFFNVSFEHGKPYIKNHSGEIYNSGLYQSFGNKSTILSDYSPDSLTITGIGDNADFKMVFRKNVGLVYVRDTANNTWTLIE